MSVRTRESLNGWWDFIIDLSPESRGHHAPGPVPTEGWMEKAILVPGSWTRGGDTPDDEKLKKIPWASWRTFDSMGYPAEWDAANTAWYRCIFSIPDNRNGRRYSLHFGGILREAWVFVNGKEAGHSANGLLPLDCDITHLVYQGENRLVVYVTDYRRDEKGKVFTLNGAGQMECQKGIWQDVHLISHGNAYVDDVTIRTSTRKNELALLVRIKNSSSTPRTVTPRFEVLDGRNPALSFKSPKLTLAAGEEKTVTVSQPWASYQAWSPRTPKLYTMEVHLDEGGGTIDTWSGRFGFREIWIDKQHLMLNGSPIHLRGDWCHKHSLDSFRPEYLRQWFGMIRDCNMNYVRPSMFPHPEALLDIADEMGILVAEETGWMFGSHLALDKEEFWQGALQHVRDMVHRDKNHPSVILWSVGNEILWADNREAVVANAPRLYAQFEELDPTRFAFHEGSSRLWDEKTQHIINRHYGFSDITGEGWWDKSQPLHVGEMGKWHYGQPIDNTVWGDDTIYASFEECHRAIAREAADLIGQARANDVCCLVPWNLSGLDNYRPWPKERTFEWPQPSAPHVKPMRTAPYGSEFAWWEPDSKGYAPGPGFEIMRHAFRPLAVVVREKQNRFFGDRKIAHTVTIVNDTGGEVSGTLEVRCHHDARMVWENAQELTIRAGHTHRIETAIPAHDVKSDLDARIITRFFDHAREYDCHARAIRIYPASAKTGTWRIGPVAVYGSGSLDRLLSDHGIKPKRVQSIGQADPDTTPVLVIERNSVDAASAPKLRAEITAFLENGGRAIVLEQTASLFPALAVENKPAARCHIRAGANDLLQGFSASDFEFWGNDPYGKKDADSDVVTLPYTKPARGNTRVLLHSGHGDFGHGGLNWTPLFETQVAGGLLIACQLRVTEKAADHPAAMLLLQRLLTYAAEWKAPSLRPVEVWGDAASAFCEAAGVETAKKAGKTVLISDALLRSKAIELAARVEAGATAVVSCATKDMLAALSKAFGVAIQAVDLGTQYNFARAAEDPLLEGISNQETYWLDNACYGPRDSQNRPMADLLITCKQAETLLTSERESCWRELFTLGGWNERLKMAVVTKYLWDGPRKSAAGMVRISHGKGELIICQVPFRNEDAYARARTFWVQVLNNARVRMGKTLLEG